MANINDIESLFSLIGQSPNDYKEFYHEKNGLHALDRWSYLKNIQLENPNEEGISIFENGPINSNAQTNLGSVTPAPVTSAPLIQPVAVEKVAPFVPADVVLSEPRIERYTSPVIDTNEKINTVADDVAAQSSTFEIPNDVVSTPEPSPMIEPLEPVTPQIYNPSVASPVAPAAPRVYSTTAIPTVPTFTMNFNSPMNASTQTSFTSNFIKPTVPANPNVPSTVTPPRFEPSPAVKSITAPESQPNPTSASPLNSIFSRLEQK
jgi:hypothetical protein